MKRIIQLGNLNLKILLPFGVALVQILINIMNYIVNEKSKNQILEMFGVSFGQILLGIFLLFKLKTINDNIKNKKSRLKGILYFGILGLIFGIYLVLNIFASIQSNIYAKNNTSLQNPHNSGLSSIEGLELVFICIFSIKLLKYKYFIHHIISIICFLIICFFIDLILENFPDIYERGALFIVIKILSILADALDYSYQKYLLDILFYPSGSILITIGGLNLIFFAIILFVCLAKGKEQSIKENHLMFMAFYKYFDDVEVKKIVIKIILNFILNLALNLLRIMTIIYLRPEYILISFTISRIFDVVLESKKYECIALFVPQLLTLMFYLEIFELNFCGLNKNTRRNIQEREQSEKNLNNRLTINNDSERSSFSSNLSEIDVSPDYSIYYNKESFFDDNDDNKNSKKFLELRTKN